MTAPEDDRLESVASAISSGAPVDWNEIPSTDADGSDRNGILRQLRLIDQIAAFHRRDQDPEHWGKLTVLERIGEGAFATVYRAHNEKLQHDVALKLLKVERSDFIDEARRLVSVRHSNVVTVHGVDTVDGRTGMWMELIKGRTLAELVKTHGPFSAREAAVTGLDLCRALAAVHQKNLLHSDIKAQNVMRELGGRSVLMDFGVSRAMSHADEHHDDDFAGTPLYVAPEVFEGQHRTRASDIYSLGVLLYHLVTGSYPVHGATREDVAQAHQRQERQHLRDARPDLPEQFVRAIERAIAVNPADRYQSAGAFETALALFLGAPAEARPGAVWASQTRSVAIVAAAIIAVAALAYFAAGGRSSRNATETVAATAAPIAASATAPLAAGAYRIDTSLYRAADGQDVRLRPGSRVRPGDNLFIEMRVSVPAYVYIVNEDEQGESYLLYPLPGRDQTNPVPANTLVRLPGAEGGRQTFWQVTSAGGREHFIIFASPEKLKLLDDMFVGLARPEIGKPVQAAKLPPSVVTRLRGVGGLESTPANAAAAGPLSAQFATPLNDSEETARGLWVRQMTVENPVR